MKIKRSEYLPPQGLRVYWFFCGDDFKEVEFFVFLLPLRACVAFLLRCCYPMRDLLSEPLFLCASPSLALFLARSLPSR